MDKNTTIQKKFLDFSPVLFFSVAGKIPGVLFVKMRKKLLIESYSAERKCKIARTDDSQLLVKTESSGAALITGLFFADIKGNFVWHNYCF